MGKYKMSYKGGMKANIIPNNQVKWKLQSADGKVFGEVSYNAYKAVENFKLDSYKPASKKEKKILNNYKNHVGIQVDGADGKPIGKVSYDGYNAILKGTYDSYKPKSNEEKTTLEKAIKEPLFPLVIEVDGKRKNFGNISYNARQYLNKYNTFDSVKSSDQKSTYWYVASNETEKKTIDKYKKFTEEYAKKQREPESVPQGIVHSLGYTVEKVGAGATDVMGDAGDFILGTGATILRPFTWGKANEAVKNYADYRFNADTLGDLWNESVESRYRVPDWYRENVGTIAYNFGGLVPATVAEVVTASSAPTYETIFAKSLGTAGKKSVAMNLASKLIKPKASDTVFFLGAAGSSTKGAYAETGNAVSSISYGVLNGVGEVFSERLFGGYGGTGIGAADDTVRAGNRILKAGLSNEIFDLRKIKGISKLASNKYGKKVLDIAMEGVEEMVMADLEPWIKKATIDPDAEISNFTQADFWKKRGSAFASGVMLSAFSNAITYPTSKAINKISTAKQKTSAIKTLNEDISKINAVLPSDAQFAPLTRKSSVEQIEAMASDIQRTKAIIEVNAVSDGINAILKNDSDKLQLLKYDSTVEEIKQRQREIAVFGVTTADFMAEELVKNNPEKFADIKAEAEANGVELVPKSTEKPSETPTVSEGDTFIESETNKTIKVLSRNEDVSSIELITADGKKETKVLPNKIVDTLKTNDKFVQVESSSDTLTTGADDNIMKNEGNIPLNAISMNAGENVSIKDSRNISSVVMAMEGSFKPGALNRLMTQLDASGKTFEDLVHSAIAYYRKTGNIGNISGYFADEGKAFIEAIESLEGENNEFEFEGNIRGRADDINGNLEGNPGERTGRDGEGIPGEAGNAEEAARNGIKGTERTERRKVKNVTFDEIVAEDYSEEMNSLQAENRSKYGVETRYFMGECVDDTGDKGDAFYYDGVLYLQADKGNLKGRAQHEITHHSVKTKAYEKFKKAVLDKMPKEQYETWYGQIKEDYSDVLMRYLKDKLEDSNYSLTDEELAKLEKDYIEEEMLANINGELVDFASEYAEEIATFRREIDRTQNNTNAEVSIESKAENKVSEYAEQTDAGGEEGKTLREAYRAKGKAEIEKSKERLGIADNNESSEIAEGEIRYSIFPGGVFPPYNKSHSDANERATRWAHNEDIETGAQRIFFYKGDAYLVEKFDSMDLGYLVVEKLKKKDLEIWNMFEVEEGEISNVETDNGKSGSEGTVQHYENNKGPSGDRQGSSDDNNSSDKHNGETAEVQGMDREQDGKRSSEHDGSRDNEHSVEDREREVKYNLSGKKKGDEDSGHEQNSNSEELGWNKTKSETEAYNRVGEVGHTQSEESNTPHTKRIHRSGVSAEALTSSGLTAEQATLKEQNKLNDMATEFYVEAKENGEQQTDVFVTENTVYYPDSAFERNDISVSNGVASFTEKRFKDLIAEYSVPSGGQLNKDYAKAYVAYISPSEFLSLTTTSEKTIIQEAKGYGKLDVKQLQNNDVQQEGPYLEIDFETGRVYEHNGRHRMVMLRDAGIDKVAIVVRDISSEQNKYKTTKHMNVLLLGQEFKNKGTVKVAPGKVLMDEIIPLSPNYREEVKGKFVDVESDIKYNLTTKTQDDIIKIAEGIQSYEDFVELARKNKEEFVSAARSNKNLQKRLENAKKQVKVTTTPVANKLKAGKITKDIIAEMEGTITARELEDKVMDAYNSYLTAIKKSGKVESKVQSANDEMIKAFTDIAIDIVDSASTYVESDDYVALRDWLKGTAIKIPDDAKADLDYATFRKKNYGRINLTNDGLPMDIAYKELCSLFPHLFSENTTHPSDQAQAVVDTLKNLKDISFNPHEEYFDDAVEYVVSRFVSEVDGIVDTSTTRADRLVQKASVEKEEAVAKAKADFEKKLTRHKEEAENRIKKLQGQINALKYEKFWEGHLSKEERQKAIKDMRERQKVAKLKADIRKIASRFKEGLDKTEKAGGYPKELVKSVAEVCSALDFHTDRTGKDGSPTKVSLKLDALKTEYDNLKTSEVYDFKSEYSEELSDHIAKLNALVKDKRIVDLTAFELENLKDILSEIRHRLSNASKQIGIDNAMENIEIGQGIIEDWEKNPDLYDYDKSAITRKANSLGSSAKSFILNPHRVNKMLAGYNENSLWWKLYDQINRGMRKASKFTMDATKPFDVLTGGNRGNEIAYFDFRTKEYGTGITDKHGREVKMTKAMICELIMAWDRPQGRSHLEGGGVKVPHIKEYNKGNTSVAIKDAARRTRAITQSDITRLKGMLDSYDLAWIEAAQYLFEIRGKSAINETSMQLLGREIAKAKNYIRLYVDKDFVKTDIEGIKVDMSLEGNGSLKSTVQNAKQPLIIRGINENVFDHIDFVAKYSGLAIPIRNFNKVYNIAITDEDGEKSSLKETISKKYGSKIQTGVIEQMIKDLQMPRERGGGGIAWVRGKWLNATFWGNIRSMLKQTTSYWTASSKLSEASLMKGLKNFTKHPKVTKAEIEKYTGTLYKREQGLSTVELGDRAMRKRLAGASSMLAKGINKYAPWLRGVPEGLRPGNWLQAMDCTVATALWEASKAEIQSRGIKVSDEGYWQAVTDLYDSVIEETQSNYDVLHRPEALKSTKQLTQTLTMFQTDNLQQTGILYDAYNELHSKSKAYKEDASTENKKALAGARKVFGKAVRSRVYSMVWLAFATMAGNMLLRKFEPYRDEEEKDITAKSVGKQLLIGMGEDMFGVLVPVGGNLIMQAADTWSEGYDFVSEPAFDTMQNFIETSSKLYDAFTSDKEGQEYREGIYKALSKFIPSVSNITGVPVKNVTDWFKAIGGYVGDIKEGKFAHDINDNVTGSLYKYSDLAAAISSGNNAQEKKILEYYKENGKEISKGQLSTELRTGYINLLIEEPKKADLLKRKLTNEYGFSQETITGWVHKCLADAVVDNDEEAQKELKNAVRSNGIKIDRSKIVSKIKDDYVELYHTKPEEAERIIKILKKDYGVTDSMAKKWIDEFDKSFEK